MTMPSLTIRSVTVRPVLVPLKRPIAAKVGAFTDWPLVLIDLETEEGVTGSAYLEPYVAKSMRYLKPAIEDLVEMQKGRPVAPADMFAAGIGSLHLVGRGGMSMIAVAGLDMAAWDALAKAAGLPLARLLGAELRPVRAYNSNALWPVSPLERVGEEAAELAAEGDFKGLKLRLGREFAQDDIDAIAACREATSPHIHLMVDFNQGLSRAEALERCHALDDQGLTWFEEPIVYDDYAGFAQLRRELKTPLQIGENLYGPRELLQAVEARAADYLMPDLMRIGGVTGWMRSAAICGAANIPMSTHLYPEFSAHLMCATESAHWLEWQDWADPILQQPFDVKGGDLIVPDRPGAGIDWDEAAVERYLWRG